jgi:hypothetical protein
VDSNSVAAGGAAQLGSFSNGAQGEEVIFIAMVAQDGALEHLAGVHTHDNHPQRILAASCENGEGLNSAIRPQGETFEAQIAIADCKYDACRGNEVHIHEWLGPTVRSPRRPQRRDASKCFSMLFKTVTNCFAIVAPLENRVAPSIVDEVASETRVVVMK